ncbi:uncharacterized protein TrAtP1_001145 [Trichoderma atroviride]|uniref:uncharacterized protein n=1 Tax=Hypocrea atroviridis TaxID=63577 RepID=UPI0033337605|nr:hypothetical protein TrAtP1_001145 [Trichoderma atroviride]
MRSLFPVVLGALGLIFVDGVVAQDPPACVPTCANQVRNQFTQFSCTSADDAACLCANANFGFGVRDCGQTGCGATDVQIQSFLAGSFCQGQQLAFSATGASAPPTSGVSSTPAATAPTDATTPAPTAPASSTSIPASSIPPGFIDSPDFSAAHRPANNSTTSLDRGSDFLSANINCSSSNYLRRTFGNVSIFQFDFICCPFYHCPCYFCLLYSHF